MITGPGDNTTAVEGRRDGHLRASHADREQVIGILKAAFVQGRLTKDELDARVDQVFCLAAITLLVAPIVTVGLMIDVRRQKQSGGQLPPAPTSHAEEVP